MLHPSHKLEYFKEHGWSEEWVDTAKEITQDEFKRKYAKHAEALAPDAAPSADGAQPVRLLRLVNAVS